MKKLICALLIVAYVFSLVACSQSDGVPQAEYDKLKMEFDEMKEQYEQLLSTTAPSTQPETDCAHDYVVQNTVEPSCEGCGTKEYVCQKCGETKTEDYGEPLGHEMEQGEADEKRSGDLFYRRDVEVCTRCDYVEYGKWESKGNIYEYAVINGVGQWLLADDLKVLDVNNAQVQYDEEYGCYLVVGNYSEPFATDSLVANNTIGAAAEIVSGYGDSDNIAGVILAGETIYVHTFIVQENGEWVLVEEQIN